jgi:predicted flap endonuclease-1-like 5' DNA nuclease
MMTVIDANTIPLIVALLIGFIAGWWMFRRARAGRETRRAEDRNGDSIAIAPDDPLPPPVRPYMRQRPIRDGIDTEEGRGIADEGASAMRDVAGEVLGVSTQLEHEAEAGPPDNLQMLKGVGPKLVQKLNENGIFRFDQIARLSANEVAILDTKLGPFKGRLERDRVVEQASYLARGDKDGFEAQFGKLGGNSLT